MNERILVWGAGAIGGTVGAFLARAGHDVTFVDVVPEHVAAIRSPGLAITGPVETLTLVAPAFLPADVTGVWDKIFLCVKAQHTEDAARALLPHLAADGYVLSLQNGLCEPVIAGIVGGPRTLGAFINFSADWMAPGVILYGGRGAFVLGELDGRITPRLEAVHTLIRAGFEPGAIVTDDINSYLWGKLGYATLLFAQALGSLGIADCLARPELLPLWRRLAGEVHAVATAIGVRQRGFNGFEPGAFAPGASEDAARASVAAMVAFNRPAAKTHSGIWRDLFVRHRRTEVDVQIAPIVTTGAAHGLAAPAVAGLVRMIHEIEAGTRGMSDDNLVALMEQTAG